MFQLRQNIFDSYLLEPNQNSLMSLRKNNRAFLAESHSGGGENDPLSVNYIADLENRATAIIGRRLRIQTGKRRKIITIEYQNDRDLEDILSKICGDGIIEKE